MEIELGKNLSLALSIKMKIIKEFGYNLNSESVILDFGCGSGKMVKELCDLGYKAFGCGTRFITEEKVDTDAKMNQGIIRTIDLNHYKLPFEDNSFDFIFSHSVFEHVKNYSQSISEIARILKPNGYCLHFFVSRYKLIEPHVFVPLSSIIQSHFWLHFWAVLGVRNEWTETLNAKETSIRFYNYLKEETNYLSRKQLQHHFGKQFQDVVFCENLVLKYSPRKGKYLYSLSKFIPLIPRIYSTFKTRAILTRFPNKTLNSTIAPDES